MSLTHHFHPAQPKQEKISFECSLPQAKSSIKKVITALPYPTDLSQALDFSAAYVDHAAHLAKHALDQFNKLQAAHNDLHATSASQVEQIKDLECHVRDHERDIRGLNSKYAELEKQRARDSKEAKAREETLKKQLADAQKALKAAEGYIAKDKLEDIKRDNAHHAHISADHLIIQQAEERATKAEAEVVKLKDLLDTTQQKLVVVEADLKTTREQLTASEASVDKLTKDLAAMTTLKNDLQTKLTTAEESLIRANIDINGLQGSIDSKDLLLISKQNAYDEKDKAADDYFNQLSNKNKEINALQAEHKLELADKQKTIDRLNTHHAINHKDENKTPGNVAVVEIVNAH